MHQLVCKEDCMSREIFCVAETQNQADRLVTKIEQMGFELRNISVATRPSEVEHIAYPPSQLLHDTKMGSLIGAGIGAAYGVVTLATIGLAGIPGWFAALLLISAGAFGGSLLGMIIGGSGFFGTARMAPAVEHLYEEEAAKGRIVISVQFRDLDDMEKLMMAINEAGATGVRYSRELVA
jgi:hypothetical protein